MTTRQLRRAAERAQRKADRKAGFPSPTNPAVAAAPPPQQAPAPSTQSANAAPNEPSTVDSGARAANPISDARLAANRANAHLSKGALTPETRAISAQNHTLHGLARKTNGTFKLLESEDPEAFAASQQALLNEHLPATETESILVQNMAESNWLVQRAQHLQDTCMNPANGAVTDKDNFNLYLRYQNAHRRNFYKALQQLNNLRSGQRKAELGVEAQNVRNEQHSMKKNAHEIELFIKEMVAGRERGKILNEILTARRANPEFRAELDAELIKIAFLKEPTHTAAQAA